MAVLLALLVISVFGVPFFTEPGILVGRILQDLFLTLILTTGVILATARPRAFPLVTLVALAAITLRWAGWIAPAYLTLAIRDATTLVAVALISVTIAMNVFGPGKVTFDRIDGVTNSLAALFRRRFIALHFTRVHWTVQSGFILVLSR
jgi:hypothetical protein